MPTAVGQSTGCRSVAVADRLLHLSPYLQPRQRSDCLLLPHAIVLGHVFILMEESLETTAGPLRKRVLARVPLVRVRCTGVWMPDVHGLRVVQACLLNLSPVTFMKVGLRFCCMSLRYRAQCEEFWRSAVQPDIDRVLV